jgi:glycosyltransferase involved in cell wall biosynthesis
MKLPLVSVGFPVFNGERHVREALDSLCAQVYPNFEVIISDNCSTDNTYAICQDYVKRDPRFRLSQMDKNRGAVHNSLFVLAQAKGEFFFWAAHDDCRAPTYISSCVRMFRENPETIIAFSRVAFIDLESRPLEGFTYNDMDTAGMDLPGRVEKLAKVLNWYAIYGMFRTSLLRSLDYKQCFGGDIIVLMKLLERGVVSIAPEPLFIYRVRPKTAADDVRGVSEPGKAIIPTRPYTGLAQDLINEINQFSVGETEKQSLRRIFLITICLHNRAWRNTLLIENPALLSVLTGMTDPQQQVESLIAWAYGEFCGAKEKTPAESAPSPATT